MKETFEGRIRAIQKEIDCPKQFKCVKSGFTDLCKAEDYGDEHGLICLEAPFLGCKFAVAVGSGEQQVRFCRCPLRTFLVKELGK